MRKRVLVLFCLCMGGQWGCDGEAAPLLGEEEAVIRALFDPGAGVLPTPTDLVRGEEGLEIPLPEGEEAAGAEIEFTTYLNSLDGYPLSTPIRFPLSGPIDETTLGGSLILIHEGADRRIETRSRYDQELGAVILEPREELLAGERYLAAMIGYERGVRGRSGERVVSDSAFFLLKSPNSLREHPNALPGESAEEREELAEELAKLQEEWEPAFRALSRRGFEREEVATLTMFRTTDRPAVRFDVAAGVIPMPNDLLFDRERSRVDLPIPSGADEEERAILKALSSYDGFSTTGAVTARSTHGFEGPPGEESFRLFRQLEGDRWEEVFDLERGISRDRSFVWVRPSLALEPGSKYVYLLTEELRDQRGRAHRAQPLGTMLTLSSPLFEEGRSQLGALSNADAARLEPLREEVNGLLSRLEAEEGLERGSLAAAAPFRTMTVIEELLERRAELYRRDLPTRVENLEVTVPSGPVRLLMNSVETVVRGEMWILDYLDPETRAFRADGEGEERKVRFVLTLPKDQSVVDPIPVVLFGHGLATSRELLYLIAEPLAAAGFAAFSFDLPYHGERTVCGGDYACVSGASCDPLGQCRYEDGSEAEMVYVSVPYLSPLLAGTQYDQLLNYPIGSGELFIDVENLVGTRDHFAQAYLDLSQAVRVLQGTELAEGIADPMISGLWLDGSDLSYLGMSLGGILGSGFSALEPKVKDFVLNVPAADLTRVIENSISFRSLFEHTLEKRGIEAGDDQYFRFMNALRWLLDPVDPINLVQYSIEAPHSHRDPLTGESLEWRERRVRIQMAQGDKVVPNAGTEALSGRMGVPIGVYTPLLTDHAFLFDPNPFAEESRRAREEVVEFFEGRE